VCQEEPAAAGLDMTTGRRLGDLSDSPVDATAKYSGRFVVDRSTAPGESIYAVDHHAAGGRQDVMRCDGDRRPRRTADQSPELVRNSASDDTNGSHCSAAESSGKDSRDSLQQQQQQRRRVAAASPPSPAAAAGKLSQDRRPPGRQPFVDAAVAPTSPRRSYRDESPSPPPPPPPPRLADDGPLDLSCQAVKAANSAAAAEQRRPVIGAGAERRETASSKRHRTHMSELQVSRVGLE